MSSYPFFGLNVQQVGGTYVEVPSQVNALGALGDESAVMMISGLGQTGAITTQGSSAIPEPSIISQKVSILGVELPLWVWLAIGLGLVGAGWFFFKKK